MNIYNSLTKKVETFEPLNKNIVTLYVCGPTVYSYSTIGSYRTYTAVDVLYRSLLALGYSVRYIMSITDVGHLTGASVGNYDIGEDTLESAAAKEGKRAGDIADFYTTDFVAGLDKLNIKMPTKFAKATEYLLQQIHLIETLERKGFTYKTSDGIYFDTSKFKDYGALSGFTPETIMEGSRAEPNPEKKLPNDFALWRFSPKDSTRWQEWDSPWGVGFPGWHIECSAIALTELGDTIDLHAGGDDLRTIHHQNELAQSESATGKKFVRYWLHSAALTVDGKRMGKNLGNAHTLKDIETKGFDLLALRYLYMTTHYRAPLNFTFEELQEAQNSLKRLCEMIGSYKTEKNAKPSDKHLSRFKDRLQDDLNLPDAITSMWDMLKSNISESQKLLTILKMDDILGLDLEEHIGMVVPQSVLDMARTRFEYQKSGIWDKADVVRRQINEMGFAVEDVPGSFKVRRRF
jgi:cysteinyl-tRNA synthetase